MVDKTKPGPAGSGGGKTGRLPRKEAGEGKIPSKYSRPDDATTADPHTDKNLDHGLDETFPASDPVSISPGAD